MKSSYEPKFDKRYFILILSAILALFALCPSQGYAQNSIDELDRNVNASGKERTGQVARVFSEIGMGLVGGVASIGIAAGIGAIVGSTQPSHPHDMGAPFLVPAFITYQITIPGLHAGGVLLGGWLTGGRCKAWAPFVGAYSFAAPFYLLYAIPDFEGAAFALNSIAIPIVSLVGAIVGYELSEEKETDRLKSERNNLNKQSAPIMIQLYSGTF